MKRLTMAALFLLSSVPALAGYTNGSKSPGDSAVPTVPCYVEGKYVKTMPVNVCLNNYKGSPSKSSSYKKK